MIRQALFVLLLGCSCSSGPTNNFNKLAKDTVQNILTSPSEVSIKDNKGNDTIFVYKEVTKYYYHAIYIDTTKQSKYYRSLIDFEFDESDKQSYQSNYEY